MEYFDFTIRFDDDLHTLDAKNGIPLEQISDLLSTMSKALNLQPDEKVVLSAIKGNCYALQLTSNSFTKYEELKVVHKKISNNDFSGINNEWKKYAGRLRYIMADKYKVQAYDDEKKFRVFVDEIVLPKVSDFFYDISSIYGVLTSIGSRQLNTRSTIHILGCNYEVEVTSQQEKELINHYKKGQLRFRIQRKVNLETKEIKSAVLESFEPVSNNNFFDIAEQIREKYKDITFENDVNEL